MVQILYKYLPQKWALNLVNGGEIKLITLFECRNVEKTKAADQDEGTKKVSDFSLIKDFSKPEELSYVVRKHIKPKKVPSYHIWKNILVTETSSSPDFYLLCLSKVLSKELMQWFGADAVVRIKEPNLFFEDLTKCVKEQLKITNDFLFSEICYINREHDCSFGDIPPVLIKAPSYAKEKEVRAIWTPLQRSIKSEPITCGAIKKYCSLVKTEMLQDDE